jgi:Protein of unknown function (DUF3168)
LAGDTTVQALLGNPARVFDHVPQGSPFPYLAIGSVSAIPFDTKTEAGLDQNLTIHSWSRYRGLKETKDIMAAVFAVLDGQSLAVTGHTLVLLRFEFATTFVDDDGLTRHGVQRFRALTQPAP